MKESRKKLSPAERYEREYGLDLFRIVSMLFVVCIHVLGHGGASNAYASGTIPDGITYLLYVSVYPAVNCFVLLSGYLLSDRPFRLSRVLHLWLVTVFWSVVIQCVFFAVHPQTVGLGTILYMFLPVSSGRYWFFNAYFVMILCSPILNHLLDLFDKGRIRVLLLGAVLLFCVFPILSQGNDIFGTGNGYHFSWFLVLYLTGGYIRRHVNRSDTPGKYILYYGALCLMHVLWKIGIEAVTVRLFGEARFGSLFFTYTSPLTFGSAVCLLLFFRSLRLKETSPVAKICTWAAPMVFSVYLIHDHPLVRQNLIKDRFSNLALLHPAYAALYFAGAVIGIFLVCLFADCLRHQFFRLIRADQMCDWLSEKITNVVEKCAHTQNGNKSS